MTDPATGGVGAFVDDTRVMINGAVAERADLMERTLDGLLSTE